jgi:hypothetical protein
VLDLGQGILEEFAERAYIKEPVWKTQGLTLHQNVGTTAKAKKIWSKLNRVKMNEHRRAMRKLNPGYGR